VSSLRVVSLLPSATEIVCALGADTNLIGISHECDFPESIRDRPVLTRSKIDASASSRSIDSAVRKILQSALSVYEVDEELLGSLSPDLIMTQDLCEVCAVSLDDVRNAVARLAQRESLGIVSLRPTRLTDMFDDVERVAESLGIAESGRRVRRDLQARVSAIQRRSAGIPKRPRVVSIEWTDPLMLGGTWMPELIELAGGLAVGVSAGQPAPTLPPCALSKLEPDVVLIKPCGFNLERTLRDRDSIERNVLSVVGSSTRVYLSDGNAFFNRPGPRLVESLEILAACVHPEYFADFSEKHAQVIWRVVPR
jgi:iron complex transport system substrate-binding protein